MLCSALRRGPRAAARRLPGPVTRTRLTAVAALVASSMAVTSLLVPGAAATGPTAAADDEHWVASWAAMPQLTERSNMPPAPYTQGSTVFANATIRQTIRATVAGSRVRLRLSNVFGGAPLPITAAALALPAGGRAGVSGIEAGSSRPLAFGGKASVTVPVGGSATSDPLDFTVAAGANLTVTLYLASGQASTNLTSHPGSRTTSHLVGGNHVSDTTLSGATASEHWYLLNGLDVVATPDVRALAVLGDSITDGRGSTTDANNRWPDQLFDRLQGAGVRTVSVVNQAAGGNRVLADGLGPSAVSRFDRDILGTTGVAWAIVFEGVNDIGTSSAGAAELIAAYRQFIAKAHAAGIALYGATITPFGGNGYDTDSHESERQAVNTWIRSAGEFDGVIDFDRVVRDPDRPRRLAAAADSGDHLHLSPTGYRMLAEAVPTTLFTR